MSVLAAVMLAANLGVVAGQTNSPISEITSALRNREFDKALGLLDPALKGSPGNAQLWMLQGLAYSGKGDREAALHSYQAALKISPDYMAALKGAAQLEYQAGSAAAMPLLEHILRLHPEDATSHAMLADLAYHGGDCGKAINHFSAARPVMDSQPGALQEYGACLLKLKHTEQAIQVFEELLKTQGDDPRARRALAAVQLNAGQPKNALASLQPLLSANPDVTTMQLAAAVYEANQNTPGAVRILREAIVKEPRDTALYVDFADIAMSHQSFQAGVEMINAGLTVQPAAAALYLARGVLYVQMADYDKAEADFAKAEQLDPHQSLSGAAEGMVAEERNQSDPNKALATIKAKLEKNPGDAFLWYLQAAILSQTAPDAGSPDFERGMSSAKKAVSLDPSLTSAHNVLAKFYLDSDQNAAAAKECRMVLDRTPEDQTALYHLVLALRRSGEQSEIPDLLKRLAKARQDATRQEAERNRYKLVVTPDARPN
ncbi:MAG TPA: tetratricopeptide repeat protein [Terracidiphilus sp.]